MRRYKGRNRGNFSDKSCADELCSRQTTYRAALGDAVISGGTYSGRTIPEPPISAGKSLSLGSPSLMGSTVSA